MDDRQRFGEVVLPHLDDALSLARWLTGSITDAEDVVQEACVRAYASDRVGEEQSACLAARDRAQHRVHVACQEPAQGRPRDGR